MVTSSRRIMSFARSAGLDVRRRAPTVQFCTAAVRHRENSAKAPLRIGPAGTWASVASQCEPVATLNWQCMENPWKRQTNSWKRVGKGVSSPWQRHGHTLPHVHGPPPSMFPWLRPCRDRVAIDVAEWPRNHCRHHSCTAHGHSEENDALVFGVPPHPGGYGSTLDDAVHKAVPVDHVAGPELPCNTDMQIRPPSD